MGDFGGVWIDLASVCTTPTYTYATGTSMTTPAPDDPWARANQLLIKNQPAAGWVVSGEVMHVRGGKSGALYRLARANHHRIHIYLLIEQPRQAAEFCVYSRASYDGLIPWQDEMLSMALYLQHDEAHFLSVAITNTRTVPLARVYNQARKKAGLTYDPLEVEA